MSAAGTPLFVRGWLIPAAGVALAVAGCTLFSPLDTPLTTEGQRSVLPPIKAAADAIHLQLVFIERPADDPLGGQLVWSELDQIGSLPPAHRAVMVEHGFKIGQSGANPPPALQKLLGLSSDASVSLDDAHQQMRGRRMGLRSGQETEIETIDGYSDCSITYQSPKGPETVDYQQSRSVLRIKPVRVQEGWVRFDFTPEVHHGEARMRHTPTEEGWALKGGQSIDARHQLKFSVTLNTGELAVISGDAAKANSPGRRFFLQERDGQPLQRFLVVRLADAGQMEPATISQR